LGGAVNTNLGGTATATGGLNAVAAIDLGSFLNFAQATPAIIQASGQPFIVGSVASSF